MFVFSGTRYTKLNVLSDYVFLLNLKMKMKTHHFLNLFYQQVNLWLILNNLIISLQKLWRNVFKYCPREYIEGGPYFFIRLSSAVIIRMRVLLEVGSYIRKYGTVYYGNSKRLNSEQSLISEHFWWNWTIFL